VLVQTVPRLKNLFSEMPPGQFQFPQRFEIAATKVINLPTMVPVQTVIKENVTPRLPQLILSAVAVQ